jgi:TonB family protein
LLLVACAFIFWPKQSTSTEQQTALPVQTSSVAQNASSGNGSAVRQVEQQKPPLSLPQKAETPPPLTVLAKGTASLQQPKENAQPVPSKQKPAELLATTSAATPHTTIAPSKNEAAPTNEIAKNPALDPKPVAEQPAAQSPAFIPVEKEPRAVNLTNPVIPDYAWLSMKDAIVVAKVLIAKDGTPSDAQIVKSTSSIFDEPVLKAIKNSQFAPGEMQQGPVSAWLTITFRLKKPG